MLPWKIGKSIRAARKAISLARGGVSRLGATTSLISVGRGQMGDASAAPSVVTMPDYDAEHTDILALLEETARLGHVPADALIGRLHACHCDRLAQDRRQLVALERELEGHLARLDARFPVPQPEPEKLEPVRGRRFGPISRDLRATAPGTDTRQ